MLRIIPRLDIKGPNLVKGIHLEGLRVLGSPDSFARYYYEQGADELLYMDVVASLYNRNSLNECITRTAKEVFIPLTVGGGIRIIDDIRQILKAGADKVAINTAAIKRPEFIKEAARRFGSSTIVVSIEVIKQEDGAYHCFHDNGREPAAMELKDWVVRAQELGAGELFITSVDHEGTGKGFDLNLLHYISDSIQVPFTVHGGAGKSEDIVELMRHFNPSGVAIASLFHYDAIKNIANSTNHEEGNRDFMLSGRKVQNIQATSIFELKRQLSDYGINCRKGL